MRPFRGAGCWVGEKSALHRFSFRAVFIDTEGNLKTRAGSILATLCARTRGPRHKTAARPHFFTEPRLGTL